MKERGCMGFGGGKDSKAEYWVGFQAYQSGLDVNTDTHKKQEVLF